MSSAYFEADVTELGSEVELMFEEKMMILFNETVPEELKDIAVVHNGMKWDEDIKAGDKLEIDGQSYNILFVGNKVNETMSELGHATYHFNGSNHSDMPGTVCLEDKALPKVNVHSTISFIR